ncbi:hypothetical protein D9M69_630040 [compost metagenome]
MPHGLIESERDCRVTNIFRSSGLHIHNIEDWVSNAVYSDETDQGHNEQQHDSLSKSTGDGSEQAHGHSPAGMACMAVVHPRG